MKYIYVNLFNNISIMNRIKNGCTTAKDADDKEENQLDRILDSNACRKLFTWARPKDAGASAAEIDKETKEEQRLRWNFDFETETPLPGRYQWVRTDTSNGHQKESDAVRSKIRNAEVRSTTRQKYSIPYSRKGRTPQSTRSSSSPESAGSCDRTLNRPRRSERKSQVQLSDSSCELEWN